MRELVARIRDWLQRDRLERELAEEMRFHHERLAEDAQARGELPDTAARTARRRFGNSTVIREAARERWSVPWLEHIGQDLRYAVRSLRRAPAFTVTVMLTLGLGIGANAAMFGVIDRLMFRPFPFMRASGQTHRVYLQTTARGKLVTRSVVPYTRYADLERWSTAFSAFAASTEWRLAVNSGDAAQERQVVGATASYFGFFDVRQVLGRFFSAEESAVPRGANVSVLGYGYWKTEFGGRDVIGQTLLVGPLVTTIIGVAPEGFIGIAEGEAPAVFLPITTIAHGVNQGNAQEFARNYNWDWTTIIARRRVGVSAEAATADLTNAFVRSRAAQRLSTPGMTPDSLARPRAIAGALRTAAGPDSGLEARTLLWVGGVAIIVLLIACANVANLMVARVLRRRREIAVRLALGVSRTRLASQFLSESILLAALGCLSGIAVAQAMAFSLARLFGSVEPSARFVADGRVLVVAGVLALVAGVLIAIGPALLATRGGLAGALRAGAREGTHQRSRIRTGLLVVQGALSVVLLVGAGLFVRSLDNVRTMWLGWDPEPVLIVTPNYRGLQLDSSALIAFRRRLLETAQSIPGVLAAARVNGLPFGTSTFELHVPGIDSVQRLGRFNYQATTPGYFKTVGTRIVRGRAFDSQDRGEAARVTVVSESMARALWPGQDPLGKCLHVGRESEPCTTVIGVAENAVQNSISDTEQFLYYLLDERPGSERPGNRLFLRMQNADVLANSEPVRRALQAIMPPPAYVTVSSLEDLVDNQRRSWRIGATMFVAFGVLALVVAAIGLYGVITYNVTQRMHELGVRIALGAGARNIVTLVVRQGVAFAAVGIAAGVAVALVVAPWVQPLLFHESARDPLIYGAVAAMVGAISLVASAGPAFRATRADPNSALRSD